MIYLVKTKDSEKHSIEATECNIDNGFFIFTNKGVPSAIFPASEVISVIVEK